MSKRLLVLCPSRGRANKINDMIKSLENTIDINHTDFHLLLDDDDIELDDYKKNVPSWIKLEIFKKEELSSFSAVLNKSLKQNNNYEFYCVTADDIVFLTKGWDKMFCNKGKFTTGIDDNISNKYKGKKFSQPNVIVKGFPTVCGMDGDIIRALGWIALPTLNHGAIDFVWYWLAKRLNILKVEPSIHWVQYSPFYGNNEEDETFKISNSDSNKIHDGEVFSRWLKYECMNDVNRVKEIIKTP